MNLAKLLLGSLLVMPLNLAHAETDIAELQRENAELRSKYEVLHDRAFNVAKSSYKAAHSWVLLEDELDGYAREAKGYLAAVRMTAGEVELLALKKSSVLRMISEMEKAVIDSLAKHNQIAATVYESSDRVLKRATDLHDHLNRPGEILDGQREMVNTLFDAVLRLHKIAAK